jgi:hypothetical protein
MGPITSVQGLDSGIRQSGATTMKIEPAGTPTTSSATKTSQSAQSTSAKTAPAASQAAASGGDAVHLSQDLRIADVAIRAAAMAGDVRPEAVAQALELLNSGGVGKDLERLADRIIDSITESRDPNT